MGDFIGHAVPGSFFILFGLWWTFAILRRYLVCRRDGKQFVSSPVYLFNSIDPSDGVSLISSSSHGASTSDSKGLRAFFAKLPGEAVVKIIFSIMGIGLEIIAHMPPPIPSRIVQHATMYTFFLMSGLVDLAGFTGVPVPDGLEYCCMALALAMEGLLFASHVHGREILDIHIHMLLVKVIAATVVVLLLEVRFRRHPLLPLSRAFLLMLQGSWFWAISAILYKHGKGHSEWDLDSPESVMLTTIYFSWHIGVILIGMVVINLVMARFYIRRNGETSLLTSPERTHKLPNSTRGLTENDGTKYSLLSSDDDDVGDDGKKNYINPKVTGGDFEV